MPGIQNYFFVICYICYICCVRLLVWLPYPPIWNFHFSFMLYFWKFWILSPPPHPPFLEFPNQCLSFRWVWIFHGCITYQDLVTELFWTFWTNFNWNELSQTEFVWILVSEYPLEISLLHKLRILMSCHKL